MVNKKFKLSYFLSIILIGILLFCLGFTHMQEDNPVSVYNVYLDGDIIGTIKDKDSFEKFINNKEKAIMSKYGVDKVYMPNGVVIKRVVTYDRDIDSNADVYNKIIDLKQFTIKGTVVTINKKDADEDNKPKKIYVLNKEIFDDALSELIKSFVDDEKYEAYMSSSQKEIVDTGSVIKNIDIDEKITYKNSYISIDKNIFTNSSTLSSGTITVPTFGLIVANG